MICINISQHLFPIGNHPIVIILSRDVCALLYETDGFIEFMLCKVLLKLHGQGPLHYVFALTAFGHAEELAISELEEAENAHRERHPDVANLLQSSESAMVCIKVETYQIVRGIDDVTWLNVEDSG